MGIDDKKLTIGLVVAVGALALVAIIISAVSLSKNVPPTITVNNPAPMGGVSLVSPGGQMQGGQMQGGQMQGVQGLGGQGPVAVPASGYNTSLALLTRYRPFGRIYNLRIGNYYGSHGYLDEAGYLTGFGPGLIDLVCSQAGIDCRLMFDANYNCWVNPKGEHPSGGAGLFGRWYDGCVGYYNTIERAHVFSFSQSYLKPPNANFFVLPGKSFDTAKNNILNSKIVFLRGWASDEKCLARQTGAVTQGANIVYALDPLDGISMLSKGYDAIFTTHSTYRGQLAAGTLKTAGPNYTCMLAGNSVMARKDSDLIQHWNRGFNKLKNSGRFKSYCAEAKEEHKEKGYSECVDTF